MEFDNIRLNFLILLETARSGTLTQCPNNSSNNQIIPAINRIWKWNMYISLSKIDVFVIDLCYTFPNHIFQDETELLCAKFID